MIRKFILGGFCLSFASGIALADTPPVTKPAPRIVIVEEEKQDAPRIEINIAAPARQMPLRMIDLVTPAASASPYNISTDDHAPDGVDLIAADPVARTSPWSSSGFSPVLTQYRPTTVAWIDVSYLRWQVSNGPLSTPLATTGNSADAVPGAIGQPGSRVIYGGQDIDYRGIDGLRLTAGLWLYGEPYGVEISMFSLERKQTSFLTSSDVAGNPPLFFPAINAATGLETSLVISDPVFGFAGNVSVTSQTRLQGIELNGLLAATTCTYGEIDLLAGVRVLDLEESITIRNRTNDIILGSVANLEDRIGTENQFYGAQIGARATGYCSKFFGSITGKIAAGWTRSAVDYRGVTTQTSPAPGIPNGTFPGGFYTQPSNMGRQQEWDCSVVPEVNLRVGCDLFGCVRTFVGYDWLYWCNVARPGDQFDRTVSAAQNPTFLAPGPILPRPTRLHATNDFFAHGFNAGIELHY